jgi:hypothetical protein
MIRAGVRQPMPTANTNTTTPFFPTQDHHALWPSIEVSEHRYCRTAGCPMAHSGRFGSSSERQTILDEAMLRLGHPFLLGTLTDLTSLQMSANRLSCTIPSWLGNLTALSDLGMSHNELNGTIPSSWGMFDIHVGFGDEQQYPDQIHALLNW